MLSCFDKAMMKRSPFPRLRLVSEVVFARAATSSFLYLRRDGSVLSREHLVFNEIIAL